MKAAFAAKGFGAELWALRLCGRKCNVWHGVFAAVFSLPGRGGILFVTDSVQIW